MNITRIDLRDFKTSLNDYKNLVKNKVDKKVLDLKRSISIRKYRTKFKALPVGSDPK
jgi:hypothetical protein